MEVISMDRGHGSETGVHWGHKCPASENAYMTLDTGRFPKCPFCDEQMKEK
jgi:hypothetical protein